MKALHIPLSEKIKAKVHYLLHEKQIKAPSDETLVKGWMIGIAVVVITFIACLVYMGFKVFRNEGLTGGDYVVIVVMERSGRVLYKKYKKYRGRS